MTDAGLDGLIKLSPEGKLSMTTTHDMFPENYGRTIDGRIYKSYAYLQRESRRTGIPIMSWQEFIRWNTDQRADLEKLFNEWEQSGYASDLLPFIGIKNNSYGYLADNTFWTSRAELKRAPTIVLACSVCDTNLDNHYRDGKWIMCSEFNQ
jgi:hypothetical protein